MAWALRRGGVQPWSALLGFKALVEGDSSHW